MKIANSLRSLKKRHMQCRAVRRKGRVYVINKQNPPLQGASGLICCCRRLASAVFCAGARPRR